MGRSYAVWGYKMTVCGASCMLVCVLVCVLVDVRQAHTTVTRPGRLTDPGGARRRRVLEST